MTEMTLGLTLVLTALLVALALLHILWAIGFWWPIRDERRLVAAVIGIRNAHRMPGPIPCALVAVLLLAGAMCLWLPPGTLRQTALLVAATVCLIRGFVPWRPLWRSLTPTEPFATLDRRVYGPLSLLLAVGFAAKVIEGMS